MAGTDTATHRHIRPLTNQNLQLKHLTNVGGPFAIGRIVDLGKVRHIGELPEVEDRHFVEHRLRAVGSMRSDLFWSGLMESAETYLQRIFGSDLHPMGEGRSCAVAAHKGVASLGYLIPTEIQDLRLVRRDDEFGSHDTLRMSVQVNRREFDLPVTDLRFCGMREDGLAWVVYRDLVDSVIHRIRSGYPLSLQSV